MGSREYVETISYERAQRRPVFEAEIAQYEALYVRKVVVGSKPRWVCDQELDFTLMTIPHDRLRSILDQHYGNASAGVISNEIDYCTRKFLDSRSQEGYAEVFLGTSYYEIERLYPDLKFLATLPHGIPQAAALITRYCKAVMEREDHRCFWRNHYISASRNFDQLLSEIIWANSMKLETGRKLTEDLAILSSFNRPTPTGLWNSEDFEERKGKNQIDVRWFRNSRYCLADCTPGRLAIRSFVRWAVESFRKSSCR